MNCPHDGFPLREAEAHRVRFATCDQCGGALLDDEEFRAAVRRFEQEEWQHVMNTAALIEHFSSPEAKVEAITSGLSAPERHCPHDGAPMRSYTYAYDSGVVLDHCDRCLALWLDGGEMHRLRDHAFSRRDRDALGRALVQLIAESADAKRARSDPLPSVPATPGEVVADIAGSLGGTPAIVLVHAISWILDRLGESLEQRT
jgi:Zn-finger nucleic acid-binding protein